MSEQYNDGDVVILDPKTIVFPPWGNQRKGRCKKKFSENKKSVQQHGFLQNIVVRYVDGKPELIAGYGRVEIALELAIEIPATVKNASDSEAFEMHMAENLDREDLSLVDQVRAAKYYTTKYAGDRKEVALRWNKPLKQVNELLELGRCSDKVLDAIAENSISAKMAIILAPFSLTVQESTLKKIIGEKWDYKKLLDRANAAQLDLSKAKFNTKDCKDCEHNSAKQIGLFGVDDVKAKCSNRKCFTEKTQGFLSSKKTELEEKFGKVIFTSELDINQIKPTNKEVLNEDTFNSNCVGCENKVVLLHDQTGKEGNYLANQCIKPKCLSELKKKVKSLPTSSFTPTVNPAGGATTINENSQAHKQVKGLSKAKSGQAKERKVSSKVIENNIKTLRSAGAAELTSDKDFMKNFMLASVALTCKYNGVRSLDDAYKAIATLSLEKQQSLYIELMNDYLSKLDTGYDQRQCSSFVIKRLAELPTAEVIATAKWSPDEEMLKAYTSDTLILMAKESGLTKHIGEEKAKKLDSLRKGDLIALFTESGFDFSHYAPNDYIEQLFKGDR